MWKDTDDFVDFITAELKLCLAHVLPPGIKAFSRKTLQHCPAVCSRAETLRLSLRHPSWREEHQHSITLSLE